jgi:hypothetical protein
MLTINRYRAAGPAADTQRLPSTDPLTSAAAGRARMCNEVVGARFRRQRPAALQLQFEDPTS